MPHGRTQKCSEREIRKCFNFLTQNETCLIDFSDSRVNYHLWKVILLSYLPRNVTQFPRGVLPYKSGGVALRKISNLVLWACHLVTNSFPPLRGTNSTTTNYITGTANCNSNKDNFRTLSSQGRFERIVINLCPNQSFSVLAP